MACCIIINYSLNFEKLDRQLNIREIGLLIFEQEFLFRIYEIHKLLKKRIRKSVLII